MEDAATFSVELTDPTRGAGHPARSFFERRRNRRGRGLRGELLPQHLPGSRSRSERFDDWVLDSVQRLERLWGERIQDLQIVVQEIPDDLENRTAETINGLLGSSTPARPGRPAVITLYRHPILMAARNVLPLNELVHDVVVEQTAELMGLEPEAVDPAYGRSQA
ncbi:metallopeptidase family protein [Arthrobacter echini]|uniref:Metallopeptidase family protein n=1 Tax=Arthrobacter echini TaxID=1529066 RepID=A0A4V6S878_9MICC|nr:metallopeptidase family protein [Arthrobacter echini]THJ67879.1 metallopeptidase family protein [Arthrobacter echini]